jgi:hypothetical protein
MNARNKARKMINAQVYAIVGLSLDDLPDTALLCDHIDTLEEMIEEADSMTPMSELLDYAQEAAMEFLEEDCDLSV